MAVVGGGPAGLMAAETLARGGATVTVFEAMPTVGRKLLLAGRGGLNLTHSEPLDTFLTRYGTASTALAPAVTAFGPDALRAWATGLGQDPVVGSSGRVFPSGFRATPLLRAWLRRLDELGVTIRTRHRWEGWTEGGLVFTDAEGRTVFHRTRATILALGGASWPRTGSDGAWVAPMEAAGVRVTPLRPANSGFRVPWSAVFAERFAGTPLKNVALTAGGRAVRGEAMITRTGIEGGGIYALATDLRDAIERDGETTVLVDLQPDRTTDQVVDRLARRRQRDSVSTGLRRALDLPPVAVGLLREATGNHLPDDAGALAALVKATPITLVATESLARAISTAGGIALTELDEQFMMRARPGTFVAGEMLDWEAPTGGYLLQAALATGVAAARGALSWLTVDPEDRGRDPEA